jgi:tetratricopeptide (TPR) repeat protein
LRKKSALACSVSVAPSRAALLAVVTVGVLGIGASPILAAGSESDPPSTTAPTQAGSVTTIAAPVRTAGEAYNEAKLKIGAKDFVSAIVLLEEVDRLQPSNADTNNLLGFAHRKIGKLDKAQAFYQKALSIDPKHRGALEYQGELYLLLNKPTSAKTNLGKLKVICGTKCGEYVDLQKAISAYKPPKKVVAKKP